jgi:arsenate reductase
MKSRQTLALIEAAGVDVKVRKYLEEVPSADEVMTILAQLGFDDPRSLMRRGENIYKELELKSESSAVKLVQAMVDHPILVERPIVTDGVRAVIGRPPEAVKVLL